MGNPLSPLPKASGLGRRFGKRLFGITTMAGAASLWGLSGALISHTSSNGIAVAAVVSLVAGVVLFSLGCLRGESPRHALAALKWRIPLLAILEAGNASLYYLALHMAPIGVVISLHLCSPVLLFLFQFVRGHHKLNLRGAMSPAALSAALGAIGLAQSAPGSHSHPLWGALLSLASAATLAVFISMVGRASRQAPRLTSAGIQMFCSGIVLLPFLIILPPARSELLELILIGLLIFAPAVFLYWEGLSHIEAMLAATIQLLEPVTATLAGIVLFATVPTLIQLLAAGLTLWSVWLEASRPKAKS